MNAHPPWLLSGRKHMKNTATLRGRTLLPRLYALVSPSEIVCVLFRLLGDIERTEAFLYLVKSGTG